MIRYMYMYVSKKIKYVYGVPYVSFDSQGNSRKSRHKTKITVKAKMIVNT